MWALLIICFVVVIFIALGDTRNYEHWLGFVEAITPLVALYFGK